MYFSTRNGKNNLTVAQLYDSLQNIYQHFVEKDYFKESGMTTSDLSHQLKWKANAMLHFQLFPIFSWPEEQITEDNLLDAVEFLYEHTAKPDDWGPITTSSGYHNEGYRRYDARAGREEIRAMFNGILAAYKSGVYHLAESGQIETRGTRGLEHILNADIVPFDEENVDHKVRRAISRWRGRHVTDTDRLECIRDLADVFEWLKTTKNLPAVLERKDESAIFNIANNFAIRHHNPEQKSNYDKAIWYSWMFHFYLATYHASIRLLIKSKENKTPSDSK